MTTETRAESAWKVWLTPLVVLIPILGTVFAGIWAVAHSHALLVVIIPGGLALTALAGRRAYGALVSVAAGFFTLLACFPAFVILLWSTFQTPICSKEIHGVWNVVVFAGGLLVFFVIGTFGFRSRIAPVIVPIGLIAGVFAILLLTVLVPGSHSYCET